MNRDRVRLPLSFDALALASDVQILPEDAWEPHFNTAYYEGEWSGVALRSGGGRVTLYAEPRDFESFSDTPVLARCPNIREALMVFRCPLNSVRLLRLGAGASVREHRDYGLEFETGEVRLHIPILSDGAEFVLNSHPVPMIPGECWYVDVNLPHCVSNPGPGKRVHLVLDCVVDEWLTELLKR